MKTELLFISNTCSEDEFRKLQNIKFKEKINASQKYFSMLISGINSSDECCITHITARSIDPSNSTATYLRKKKERMSNGITFVYTSIINIKVIKNIHNVIAGFVETTRYLIRRRKKGVIIVIDPLSYDVSLGGILASKLFRKSKRVGIITDLPCFLETIHKSASITIASRIKSRIREKITNALLFSFDGYCFLVESMNDINKNGKPYIVIEGMIPADDSQPIEEPVGNAIVYAGGLYPQFGVNKLVDAMTKVNGIPFEMVFYGEGSSKEYITNTNLNDPRIKYGGLVSIREIERIEKSAKLLINPRPTNEDFTKYSFPSKTLEYLASGRPVLTTRLAGIPEEYFDYLIPIDDESEDGIRKTIMKTLSLQDEALRRIGANGQRFVLNNKTSRIQGCKFLSFIKQIMN